MIDGNNSLPQLPEGWVWTRLVEICSNERNRGAEGSVPYLEIGNIDIPTKKYYSGAKPAVKGALLSTEGDILISRVRPTRGAVTITREKEIHVSSALTILRPFLGISGEYMHYFLAWNSTFLEFLGEKSTGTMYPTVKEDFILEYPISLSPLPEQYRIVAKLEELFTKLDAGVEGLKKVKSQLTRYRQAVLKHAFEGKLTKEWQEAHKGQIEPASVLLERIKEDRKKNAEAKYKELPPLDTSDLPEPPEGWVWTRVGEVSDAIGGHAFKSSSFKERGKYQVIKIGNIKMGSLKLDKKTSFIDDIALQIANKYKLHYGDLVITLTGTRKKRDYGFVAMVKNEENLLLNQRLAVIRFAKPLLPEYFQYALRSEHFQNSFFKYETGNVGQGNVGMNAIVSEAIAVPPLQEQHKIVEEIERLFSVADQIEKTTEQSLKQTERLRQSILKRAFEGKLVPQDPTDEPAEELLERTKAEKARRQVEEKATGRSKNRLNQRQGRLMQYGK